MKCIEGLTTKICYHHSQWSKTYVSLLLPFSCNKTQLLPCIFITQQQCGNTFLQDFANLAAQKYLCLSTSNHKSHFLRVFWNPVIMTKAMMYHTVVVMVVVVGWTEAKFTTETNVFGCHDKGCVTQVCCHL